jgi:hypothetical protein
VVKVTTNLIVYSRLGSDEKLKLTTKSEVQATIFWIYTHRQKKRNTISQQQIIPIIPILMYFDQEAMIANITLSISIGYFISNFA